MPRLGTSLALCLALALGGLGTLAGTATPDGPQAGPVDGSSAPRRGEPRPTRRKGRPPVRHKAAKPADPPREEEEPAQDAPRDEPAPPGPPDESATSIA